MLDILLLIFCICLLIACMSLIIDNKELKENPKKKEVTFDNDIIILFKCGKKGDK